tara:strand:+ start:4051 stop:4584 length:534 start_codon:yes stop_codon:yes gene_type:complete
MGAPNTKTASTDNLSTSEVAFLFNCSDGFARELMQRLEIPKRGQTYPVRRIFLALGLPQNFPTDAPELREPLLDVPAIARITGEAEKTVLRMMYGLHRDKSFINALHAGARKHLLFEFEVDAWMNGIEARYIRYPESIHPELQQKELQKTKLKREKIKVLPRQHPATTVTDMFIHAK